VGALVLLTSVLIRRDFNGPRQQQRENVGIQMDQSSRKACHSWITSTSEVASEKEEEEQKMHL
jgi:hypothetical protein